SIPPASTASSPGTLPAAGAVTRTGAHPVPPRLSDVSGRYAPVGPPPEPEAPAWRRYALLGAGALLAFVAVVVAVRWVVDPGAGGPPVEPAPIDAPAPAPEPARPAWVSVTVEGLPPGAQVVLDGLPASSPMRMRRGGQHVVEIRAPG